jgi:hypothetical protein
MPNTQLSPVFRQRFFDNNGIPLNGGQVSFFIAGTSTPKATYTDFTGTVPNSNPVILDSNGYADIWLSEDNIGYKVMLQTSVASGSNLLWTVDDVFSSAGQAFLAPWSSTFTYSKGNIVSEGGRIFVSVQNTNLNHDPALDAAQTFWTEYGGAIRTVTAFTTIVEADDTILFNTTAGQITQPLPDLTGLPTGTRFTLKNVGTAQNRLVITCFGGQLIDGQSSYICESSNSFLESVTVESNGTNWEIVDGFTIPLASIGNSKLAAQAVQASNIQNGAVVEKYSHFNSPGTSSFVVPTNVVAMRMYLVGGGGGGGCGGVQTGGGAGGGGGGGGSGVVPTICADFTTVPGESLVITVGGGGAGGVVGLTSPQSGVQTSVQGTNGYRVSPGAAPGANAAASSAGTGGAAVFTFDSAQTAGGNGGNGGGGGGAGGATGQPSGLYSQPGGSGGGAGAGNGGGGGGGGAGVGPYNGPPFGGAGGNGGSSGNASTPGSMGTGSGAGGGGGAGSKNNGAGATNGGNGATGAVILFWVGTGP